MLDRAKKIILSVSVIVLFALYALQQKERAPVVSTSVVAVVATPARAVAAAHPPTVTPVATHPVPTMTPAANRPIPTVDGTSSAAALAPTETPVPSAAPSAAAAARSSAGDTTGAYRNGTYTGSLADANWGEVEVQVVITNGQIGDVQFLEYPNHRNRSQEINAQAMPLLTQEAVSSQQANVDIVTGATDTSQAFIESLTAALQQATT